MHSPLDPDRRRLGLAITAAALNLRPAFTSLAVVLRDSPLPGWAGATAVAMPPAALAAGALLTRHLATRHSPRWLLIAAHLVLATALLIRSLGSTAVLLVGTAIAALAIAVISVLLPAAIRIAPRSTKLSAQFATALGSGAALGAIGTAALLVHTGWRTSTAIWALLPLASVITCRLHFDQAPAADPGEARERPQRSWQLTTYFAATMTVTMAVLGWLPSALRDYGVPAHQVGTYTTIALLAGIPTARLLPATVGRGGWRGGVPVLAVTVAMATGLLGLHLVPGAALCWCVLIGLGLGIVGHAFAVIPYQATPTTAAHLSASVQTAGYATAGLGVLTIGLTHVSTTTWTTPAIIIAALLTIQAITATRIATAGPNQAASDRDARCRSRVERAAS